MNGVTLQRFGPRTKNERWAELNKERSRRLERLGLMTDGGRAVCPNLNAEFEIMPDIIAAFKARHVAWQNFQNFPLLYQRVRIDKMEAAGYICMSVSGNRMSFNKGYTSCGYSDKVFHIHCHMVGDNNEIVFRDYLIAHPEIAKEYEKLKLSLFSEYKHDRDGYTEAKSEFVRQTIKRALKQ